jgi:hypothetical protein
MMKPAKRRKSIDVRTTEADAAAVHVAIILDRAADNLATCVGRMAERLYMIHPNAKQLIAGVAGVEGLTELVLQRFNAKRYDDSDAPSVEAITRAAVAKHPVRK